MEEEGGKEGREGKREEERGRDGDRQGGKERERKKVHVPVFIADPVQAC